MCFGKGLNQNKSEHCEHPSPNNCCGGFALNAVLAELITGFNNPNEVYNTIQTYQTATILPCSGAYAFLHNPGNIANGTLMSLPSGICGAFNKYTTGKSVTVYYNADFAASDFKDLINEEKDRIEKPIMRVEEFEGDISKKGWLYALVLVNGCHWIAVKNETTSFTCYDPDSGNATTASSMEAAIKGHPRITVVNGLYICIV